MKCIVLAGQKGDQLSAPKQFMPFEGGQSLFQETIARNLPLCDEMCIVAAASSGAEVLSQMAPFRELTWRLNLEEKGRGTFPAILLSLWMYAPSELLCVVPSDWAVDRGDYRGDVLKAMEAARNGKIAVVGEGLKRGILIFENGILQKELRTLAGEDLKASAEVFRNRHLTSCGCSYSEKSLARIREGSVERLLLSVSGNVEAISASFRIRTADVLPQLGNREPFVRMKPAFKDYLWGGVRLREQYGKRCDYPQIAESWELSAHPAGESVVTTGKSRGLTFGQYLNRMRREAWGWKCAAFESFPILIKFLDAKQDLSIQVHPDDDYALNHEGQYGKNEMWYVLDCEEDSKVAMGFSRAVTEQEVLDAIADGTLDMLLNWVPVHPGDVLFIPAGTVHAVGKGCFIMEIQQSSDITYRLYDYNRRDRYGNLRELQTDKALQVMNMGDGRSLTSLKREEDLLCSCKYFEARLHHVEENLRLQVSAESFVSLVFLSGRGEVTEEGEDPYSITYWPGDSVFLPAGNRTVVIQGPCEVVETRV